MKVAVIVGTRPEIIKMAPVIRELEKEGRDYFILHTGQHYSYSLDRVFFEQLRLPAARYNLEAGSGMHGEQTARMLVGVEKVLVQEKPDILLVQGDTNSVLAGALAACKLHIAVGHVEAGLRSYDRNMAEEINRILTDHCSDYLFAPTPKAHDILTSEGIPGEKIFMTGNTIVDATFQNLEFAQSYSDILGKLELLTKKYFLVTLHRQENVDNQSRLASILEGLEKVAGDFHMPVVYPVHPHSRKSISRFGLRPHHITMVEPMDFFSFLQLESNARLILTDSGGVQEEACILGVPCVTLRDNTERPETIEVNANILSGASAEKICECAGIMLNRPNGWANPFGDGNAGKRIMNILMEGKHG